MNAAHIHLMLNHIPVLGAIASFVLVLIAGLRKEAAITRLTFQFLVLIGLLTIPVYFTGEPAEKIVEHVAGVSEAYIEPHETAALFGFILTEILAVIGLIGLVRFRANAAAVIGYWKIVAVIALLNASVMLGIASTGGQIRHTEVRKGEAAPAK